jgi:hypothetical protein
LAERFYSGEPGGQVTAREGASKRPLDPRFDLRKHSPPGLAPGDSAVQLALALLADALDNDERALHLHEDFNCRMVTLFPKRWTITRSRILGYLDAIENDAFSAT